MLSRIAITALLMTSWCSAKAEQSWKPVFGADGQLELPKTYRTWVYLGSPLTPEALNDEKAGFPEFHNVYVPGEVLENFKKTGEYRDGDIFVKELQLTLPPREFPDGSRTEVSGRGYFPGAFNGLDVMVMDSTKCKDTMNWCYFNFGHHALPYEVKAAAAPTEKCAFCHMASADKNQHFTQFYQQLLH
jgi:hypothetical protein